MAKKYPTPLEPAVFVYRGNVPAMKNEKMIYKRGDATIGIGRSPGVRRFLAEADSSVQEQFERQPFDQIQVPTRVGVHARIGIFSSSIDVLPKKDLDNLYTTLQETLQGKIIEDDRQIVSAHLTRTRVEAKQFEFATLFVWALDNDVDDNVQFFYFYENFQNKRLWEWIKDNGKS